MERTCTSPSSLDSSLRDHTFINDSVFEQESEDELDPRIKEELDKLNDATNEINILEKQLDEARAGFRQKLTESTRSLKLLMNKLGQSIDKARPYFEAQNQALKAQQECQEAANRFEKSCEAHKTARDAISVAEEKIAHNDASFDAAWQEMLNHANLKVLDAERDKERSEAEHQDSALAFAELKSRVLRLEKSLKKCVNKARPYFEERAKHLQSLEGQKEVVIQFEESYKKAKADYATALGNLETISEEIHEKRQRAPSGQRGECVGAEAESQAQTTADRQRVWHSPRRFASEPRKKTRPTRPFNRNTLRSSLCMDLGVDFDIGDVDVMPPSSPSSKSIDLGSLRYVNIDEFEVLDINRLQEMLAPAHLRQPEENDEVSEH